MMVLENGTRKQPWDQKSIPYSRDKLAPSDELRDEKLQILETSRQHWARSHGRNETKSTRNRDQNQATKTLDEQHRLNKRK
jgi:hypothetical protein